MHLFLDRDGVINKRKIGGYIQSWDEFEFLEGVLEAAPILARKFETIVVVTNQAGIGKGIMTEKDLQSIHTKMIASIVATGGRIEAAFYCPHRSTELCFCRKPRSGMAFQAKNRFPRIDFTQTYMVGDSYSDMIFGIGLGMTPILIRGKQEDAAALSTLDGLKGFDSLLDFSYCENV